MESKQEDFCIIKQKIIKTDEMLQMYMDSNNKLKKSKQLFTELKCKYDRSQLENERCEFSLGSLKSKHAHLEKQCEELNSQRVTLEQKYNKTIVESHGHIRALQEELQMLKELQKASESLIPKKNTSEISKKCEEIEKELAKYKETDSEQKKEYKKLLKENANLKERLDKMYDEKKRDINMIETERTKLHQDIHGLRVEMDNKIKIHGQVCQQKDKEIHDLKLSLSKTSDIKKRVTRLEQENARLRKENLIKEKSLLNAIQKNIKKTSTVSIQTDENWYQNFKEQNNVEKKCSKSDVESLNDLFKEMIYIPPLLSPFRSVTPEVSLRNISKNTPSDIPDIVVTPSTPLEENIQKFSEIAEYSNNEVKPTLLTEFANIDEQLKVVNNPKESLVAPNTPIIPVNRNLRRKIFLKNQKILENRQSKKRRFKTRTGDSVLRAIQILEKSKINFTISNETKTYTGARPNVTVPLVECLTCKSHNCKQMYMLLNQNNENKSLLGFFNEPTVTASPSVIIMDNTVDRKKEITPENILEKLADLVFEKIKDTAFKGRRRTVESSGYISETEAELEHLFEKPRNDTLAVNALLMKKLREGDLMQENTQSEISSESSLPFSLNDRSQSSSVMEPSMSTNCSSRPESTNSNVEGESNTFRGLREPSDLKLKQFNEALQENIMINHCPDKKEDLSTSGPLEEALVKLCASDNIFDDKNVPFRGLRDNSQPSDAKLKQFDEALQENVTLSHRPDKKEDLSTSGPLEEALVKLCASDNIFDDKNVPFRGLRDNSQPSDAKLKQFDEALQENVTLSHRPDKKEDLSTSGPLEEALVKLCASDNIFDDKNVSVRGLRDNSQPSDAKLKQFDEALPENITLSHRPDKKEDLSTSGPLEEALVKLCVSDNIFDDKNVSVRGLRDNSQPSDAKLKQFDEALQENITLSHRPDNKEDLSTSGPLEEALVKLCASDNIFDDKNVPFRGLRDNSQPSDAKLKQFDEALPENITLSHRPDKKEDLSTSGPLEEALVKLCASDNIIDDKSEENFSKSNHQSAFSPPKDICTEIEAKTHEKDNLSQKIRILNVEIYKKFIEENVPLGNNSEQNKPTENEETINSVETQYELKYAETRQVGSFIDYSNDLKEITVIEPLTPFSDAYSKSVEEINSPSKLRACLESPKFVTNSNRIMHDSTVYSTPDSSKTVEDNTSPGLLNVLGRIPVLLSPVSDDLKKISVIKSISPLKSSAEVKFSINNKFKTLFKNVLSENDSVTDESTTKNSIANSVPKTGSISSKKTVCEEETGTLPISPNADTCINSLLRNKNVLTKEIDSFLNIFQSNKSFSDLNKSPGCTIVSKAARQLVFQKPPSKDTLNKIPDCPESPVPFDKGTLEMEYTPKIIPLERITKEAEDPEISENLPPSKKKRGRPKKNKTLEQTNSNVLDTKPMKRKTRCSSSKVSDSDEFISPLRPTKHNKTCCDSDRTPNKRKMIERIKSRISESTDTSDSGVLDKEYVPKKLKLKKVGRPRKIRQKSASESDKNELDPTEKEIRIIEEDKKVGTAVKTQMECNPNQSVPVKRGRGRPRKYPKKEDTEPTNPENIQIDGTKKKKLTKLQSKIKRQMNEKHKMLQKQPIRNVFEDASVDCDVRIKENQIINPVSNADSKLNKKINIIQNIAIPTESGEPIDLIEQSNANILKNKVTVKKKRVQGDILSQIMKGMDKVKPKVKSAVIKKDIPDGIDEKQWRKNVLDIAEITHHSKNIDMKDIYGIQPYKKKRSGILIKDAKVPEKIIFLLKKLLKISNEDDIPESIMLEFKRLTTNEIIDIVLYQVSKDIYDKAENKYYPAPLMTRTQRIFLGLLVRLEKEKGFENIIDRFLFKTQEHMFKIGCGIRAAIPLTRLFLSLCRLHADINRMRTFCCEAFFFTGDLAIPIFFTVLTSWTEVIPLEVDMKTYPLAKILIQLVHLKTCSKPGYNLFALKCLLSQYHGYPKERWNCDEIFEEITQEYLANPSITSDYAIRLFCKNKDTNWVYKKLNQFFKPLIYKIPSENVNFKATTIILMGKICRQFKPKDKHDEKCLVELKRWFEGLLEDNTTDLIKQSVTLSMDHLPGKGKRPANHYYDKTTSTPTPRINQTTN